MKRLLTTTTALAVALGSAQPFPLWAQALDAEGRVVAADGTVLCTPTEAAPCDLEATLAEIVGQAEAAAVAEAAAAAEAAAVAEAEAAAQAAIAAEAAAAAQATEAAAAEAAVAAGAAAAGEAEAAATAAAEAAAEAAIAAEAEAVAAAEATAAAEAAIAAEAAAAEAAAADAAAATAAAEAAAAADAEAVAAATEAAEAEAAATAAAAADAAATTEAAPVDGQDTATTSDQPPETRPEPRPDALEAAAPEAVAEPETVLVTEAAPDATAEAPVVPPAPEQQAVTTLQDILAPEASPEAGDIPFVAAAAAALSGPAVDGATTEAPDPDLAPTTTTTATITEADTRSSAQEFAAAPQADTQGRRGLSDLEKVGLVALGALAVGAILKNGDRVTSNTGDRVVVERNDGSLMLLKDDDTLLRRPGSTLQTETFRDGSTRTTVDRNDGSRIITIRDASGRVLRRARVDADGRETLLIDDITAPVQPIDVTTLPRNPTPTVISTQGSDAALAASLAAISARDAARGFSLRQIRDIREVRAIAPQVDVAPITFATGSSAIPVSEAEKLAALGRFIAETVRARPSELFLIEGHTDAVGSAASNLTLSDRRAESLALALTEYFGVPPENLVVQGYGESDLLIPTEAAEPLNRRVAVRMISPLLTASR